MTIFLSMHLVQLWINSNYFCTLHFTDYYIWWTIAWRKSYSSSLLMSMPLGTQLNDFLRLSSITCTGHWSSQSHYSFLVQILCFENDLCSNDAIYTWALCESQRVLQIGPWMRTHSTFTQLSQKQLVYRK